MYHQFNDIVSKDILCLLFSHEGFKGIIQGIHKCWMMNRWLGSCEFAGETLVSVRHNVFILIRLPAMKNVIHIQVVSVIRLRSQILDEITLIGNCLSLVFQGIKPETKNNFLFREVDQNEKEAVNGIKCCLNIFITWQTISSNLLPSWPCREVSTHPWGIWQPNVLAHQTSCTCSIDLGSLIFVNMIILYFAFKSSIFT